MAELDFIDISDKANAPNRKKIVTVPRWTGKEVFENNSGLTREGIIYQIYLWSRSMNTLQQARYISMLHRCTKIEKSEVLQNGDIVLSRRTVRDGATVRPDVKVLKKPFAIKDSMTGEEITQGIDFEKMKLDVLDYVETWAKKYQVIFDRSE